MDAHAAQQRDDGGQQECGQQRERDRDEHHARPVQARDGQDQGAQDGKSRTPGRVEGLERAHANGAIGRGP